MNNLVHQKKLEFQRVLESNRNCKIELVSENRSFYNVISESGVKWKERSYKWGIVAEGKKRLKIDLDFPADSFSLKSLCEYTDLQLKGEVPKPSTMSHINPTISGEKYDTLRIILYEDRLESFDFENYKFKELLAEIINFNVC